MDDITLTAAPSVGCVFEDWTGEVDVIANTSENPVTFKMGTNPDFNRVITANFALSNLRYTVSTTVEPARGGSVTLVPKQPAEGYRVNESVSVYAKPDGSGWVFSGWRGDLYGNDNPRTFLVSKDKSVTAIFTQVYDISSTEQSSFPWWLWVIAGLGGLFGLVILVRLLYSRMNRSEWDEPE